MKVHDEVIDQHLAEETDRGWGIARSRGARGRERGVQGRRRRRPHGHDVD